MPTLNQILSYLILGQKGGRNRVQIIDLLKDRPYNLNQLTEILGVNYRTVKHHIDVLMKNEIVTSSRTGGYGEVYYLTPEMDQNMAIFNSIVRKLTDITKTPGFYRNIMEQTKVPIVIVDPEGVVSFWNTAAETMFGYTGEEMVGHPIILFQDAGELEELIDRLGGGEDIAFHETRFTTMNGNILDVSLSMDPIEDDAGGTLGITLLVRDITERKEEVRALRESERKYRIMFEASPDIVYEIDETGIIRDANHSATDKLGYTKEELIGRPLSDLFSEASKEIFKEKFPVLLKEGSNQASVELVAKDGSSVPIDCKALVVRNDEGGVERIVVSERDALI